MVVKEAIACTNYGLAITPRIPGNAYARSNVIRVGWNSLDHAKRFLSSSIDRRARSEGWQPFDIVPNSIVNGELAVHLPTILRKHTQSLVVERAIRLADPLVENRRDTESVCLYRTETRETCESGRQRTRRERSEIEDAAVIQGENLRFRRTQLYQVRIGAKFDSMRSLRPRKVIRKLETPLNSVLGGKRFATQVRRTSDIVSREISSE